MNLLGSTVRALVLALSLASGHAFADINYSFFKTIFSDGGTLTGTFTTNDARTSLLNYNVTSSPGTGGLGFTYTSATSSASSTSLPFILVLNTPPANDDILQVTFTNLTPAGSLITIGDFDSFEQHLTARRTITTGSVVAAVVPEPESYALLLAGLGLIAFVKRRKLRPSA